MKKMRMSVIAILAVMLALFASAFTAQVERTDATPLHWFDSVTGAYVDYEEAAVMETNICPGIGENCVDGFESITGGPGEEEPVFETYVTTLEKE